MQLRTRAGPAGAGGNAQTRAAGTPWSHAHVLLHWPASMHSLESIEASDTEQTAIERCGCVSHERLLCAVALKAYCMCT